ncbi:MAG TPA: P-II family nitrogen regulator [Caldithrix abyssi]|uniref:P-II family nitrogen regulator n=1 Tax=Caldithrix abyssi TaxID=187145 RepID=A0A7V4U3P1_CALAY|nr:P-II family nitrogen regulator [Caldithrix abyssi]
MKHIIAYIKPHKLSIVTMALHEIKGLSGMTILDVRGCGRGGACEEPPSVEEELYDFVKHIKIEVFCLDSIAEEVVSVIQTNAHTGLKGDGKIYITEVSDAIRISSGERGEVAV